MKKSILTKILLAMLMVALVFAMVACGGNDKNPGKTDDGKTDDGNKGNETQDATLADQIIGVLKGANPLLKTLHGITADDTVGLDLGLTVDFSAGKNDNEEDVKGTYSLGLKGKLNKTTPELDITYKANSKDWFKLAYKNGTAYLGQPLTAVNTGREMDKVSVNVKALDPAVASLMGMLMDFLPTVAEVIPDGISDEMSESIGGFIDGFGVVLDQLGLKITETATGNQINIASDTVDGFLFETIMGILFPEEGGKFDQYKGTVDSVIEKLRAVGDSGKLPALNLDINQKTVNEEKIISGLDIGYVYNEAYYGTLSIDIAVSTTDSKVGAVTAPSDYKAQALEAVVDAMLPQKGVNAELTVDVNPNFSADYMGYASLAFKNTKKGTDLGKVEGWANNGKALFFDTTDAYKALGIADKGAVYKASLASDKSVADLINEWAAKLAGEATPAKNADATESSQGILTTIYGWIGGDVAALKGKDPTEPQMMAQVRAKIGANCTFTITDDYFGTVKNIVKLFAENDEWITGIDMVDTSVVNTAEEWGDLLDAINADNFKASKDGVYGIVNWDTTNYKGGIQLYKAGEKNDLLDVVNVFVKNSTTNAAFTVDNICDDLCNYYLAALGYMLGDGIVFTATEKMEIDQIDAAYEAVKNDSTKTQAQIDAAKKEHDDALKAKYYDAAHTQKVLKVVFGVDADLKGLIEGGLNLYVGSVKNGGLNGFIGLKNENSDKEVTYVEIGAKLGFVDNTVVADAKKAADARKDAEAKELTYSEDDMNSPILNEEGKHLDKDGKVTEKEEEFTYNKKYPNGSAVLDELQELRDAYCNKDFAA